MTIKLIDHSEHSFVVDDSLSTRKIRDKLGEYLQLGKDAEQLCLCYPGSTIKKRMTFYSYSFIFILLLLVILFPYLIISSYLSLLFLLIII